MMVSTEKQFNIVPQMTETNRVRQLSMPVGRNNNFSIILLECFLFQSRRICISDCPVDHSKLQLLSAEMFSANTSDHNRNILGNGNQTESENINTLCNWIKNPIRLRKTCHRKICQCGGTIVPTHFHKARINHHKSIPLVGYYINSFQFRQWGIN